MIRVYGEQHMSERVIVNIAKDLDNYQPDIIYHELCIVYDPELLGDRKCIYIEPSDLKALCEDTDIPSQFTGKNKATIGFPIEIAEICIKHNSILASIDIPYPQLKQLSSSLALEHQSRESYMTSVLLEELDENDLDNKRIAIVVGAAHLRGAPSVASGGHSPLRAYLDSRDDVVYGNPGVLKAVDKEINKLNKQNTSIR